jgi:hypothetical protein
MRDTERLQDERLARLIAALTESADADYRGNRSPEAEITHKALVAEGLREESK